MYKTGFNFKKRNNIDLFSNKISKFPSKKKKKFLKMSKNLSNIKPKESKLKLISISTYTTKINLKLKKHHPQH